MSYLDQISEIWEMVKEELRKEMYPPHVDLWFGELKVHSYANCCITLETQSEFKLGIIEKYNHTEKFERLFSKFLEFPVKVEVIYVGNPAEIETVQRQLLAWKGLQYINVDPPEGYPVKELVPEGTRRVNLEGRARLAREEAEKASQKAKKLEAEFQAELEKKKNGAVAGEPPVAAPADEAESDGEDDELEPEVQKWRSPLPKVLPPRPVSKPKPEVEDDYYEPIPEPKNASAPPKHHLTLEDIDLSVETAPVEPKPSRWSGSFEGMKPTDVDSVFANKSDVGDGDGVIPPDGDDGEGGEPKSHSYPIGGTLPPYNFEYTFDNFIVGASNKFAHAACISVANEPAKGYNPLFIYGQSGLGKTHLLYAITNLVKRKKPDVRIIYIKGEDFTNQMIDCLSRSAMGEFHEKYRTCDMLLIDDIQFIAGKVATQEEFFHTFNTLYENHKQIILASDRPPYEINPLIDRLKTRFEWGLIADIQPPDLELRIAIIKKKAEQVNISLPEEVLTFLAENLRSNIRQIEGAIKKLAALNFLSGRQLSLETAEGCISELLGGEEPVSVTVDKIFGVVYRKYGITRDDLVSQKRNKEIAYARHITNYLIRNITEMSLPNIGKLFNRNHSTVLSSIEFVTKRMLNDRMFVMEIRSLKKEITGLDEPGDIYFGNESK